MTTNATKVAEDKCAAQFDPADPPLRFDLLCRRVLDEREMALELLGAAIEHLGLDLAEMRRAVDSRETTLAKDLAHRLKGTAGNLSAEPLRRACSQLERAAAAGQIDSLGPCCDEVEAAAKSFWRRRAIAAGIVKASREQGHRIRGMDLRVRRVERDGLGGPSYEGTSYSCASP